MKTITGWIITTIRQKYIIKTKENSLYLSDNVRKLFEKGLELGIKMEVFTPEEIGLLVNDNDNKKIIINNEERELPDFIIPRTGAGTTNKASRLYCQLEFLGVHTVNDSKSIDACVDKFYHLQLLAQQGLPIPKTVYVSECNNVLAIERELGFPLVVKIWPGSFGEGVLLANNRHTLEDLIGMLIKANSDVNILAQEYVKDSSGRDIRVFVLGGKILAFGERQAQDGNFKSNLDRGGALKKINLDANARKIALDAVKVLGLECAGVDLLYDGDSYKICEVNSAPGFRTIDENSDLDAATAVFDYIFGKLTLGMPALF